MIGLDDFLRMKPQFVPYKKEIRNIIEGNFSLLREDLRDFIQKSIKPEKTLSEEKRLEKLERYFLRYFSKHTSA